MESKKTRIVVERLWQSDLLAVHIAASREPQDDPNYIDVATSIIVERSHIAEAHPPVAHMTVDAAHKLADSLWLAGIYPSKSEGSGNQLSAMKEHLKDLRELVQKLLPAALRKS